MFTCVIFFLIYIYVINSKSDAILACFSHWRGRLLYFRMFFQVLLFILWPKAQYTSAALCIIAGCLTSVLGMHRSCLGCDLWGGNHWALLCLSHSRGARQWDRE